MTFVSGSSDANFRLGLVLRASATVRPRDAFLGGGGHERLVGGTENVGAAGPSWQLGNQSNRSLNQYNSAIKAEESVDLMRLSSLRKRPASIIASCDVLAAFIQFNRPMLRQSLLYVRCQHSCSALASQSTVHSTTQSTKCVSIGGKTCHIDDWYNVSSNIASSVGRQLHLQNDHPISITRQIIESNFPSPTYKYHNNLSPVVSTQQNFDSLGFSQDHPGRSRTDTYYINKDTVLRTHTSAHQADTFRANESEGYLISADVYRRDAIDRSHYPVFHQMEGARMWNRSKIVGGDIAKAVYDDLAGLPEHDMNVEDPNPAFHSERNPLQLGHYSEAEAEALVAHLKRSLELVVADIFSRARAASAMGNLEATTEPLRVRWIEAYFPFTSPSWELEIFWQGDWLEVLGCGIVRKALYINAGVPEQVGWAFGIGLERIAMLLFDIPDIRLFWSRDKRFLEQFEGFSKNCGDIKRFVPYSKYPPCYKDVAFWLRSTSSSAGGGTRASSHDFHENDVMEIVREIGGDKVEDVRMVDEFTHPKTGRKSLCYRINYRSLEGTLTNHEANGYHRLVERALVKKLGVELR